MFLVHLFALYTWWENKCKFLDLDSEESDEKYNERHERWKQHCEDKYNTAEIIIAKQRHGPIGIIKTHFDANFTRFSDLSTKNYENIVE